MLNTSASLPDQIARERYKRMMEAIEQRRQASPALGDPIGKYGPVDYLRIGTSLRQMRRTEVQACKHIRSPDDPDFVPPAAVPSLLYCSKCRERKPPSAFRKDSRLVLRDGCRTDCKACEKVIRKQAALKKRKEHRDLPIVLLDP